MKCFHREKTGVRGMSYCLRGGVICDRCGKDRAKVAREPQYFTDVLRGLRSNGHIAHAEEFEALVLAARKALKAYNDDPHFLFVSRDTAEAMKALTCALKEVM